MDEIIGLCQVEFRSDRSLSGGASIHYGLSSYPPGGAGPGPAGPVMPPGQHYGGGGSGGSGYSSPDLRMIDVKMNVVDAHAHPIYLVATDGKIYNWQNIISIKKVA